MPDITSAPLLQKSAITTTECSKNICLPRDACDSSPCVTIADPMRVTVIISFPA
jgi:hypothetical protein